MNEKQNLRLKRNVGLDYVHTFLSNMNMQSSILGVVSRILRAAPGTDRTLRGNIPCDKHRV